MTNNHVWTGPTKADEGWSEWIEWGGGDMPLDGGVKVEVKREDLKKLYGFASQFYWGLPEGDSSIIAYRYRLTDNQMTPESDMHPDLEWLARNVSEWASQENLSMVRKSPVGAEFYDPEYRPGRDGYTKPQWLQARKDLGLIMSDDEMEMPAEEWAGSVPEGIKAPLGGMTARKYNSYFKDVRHIDAIDVYRVVDLFGCEKHGHPISHAAKKLLLSGCRTGGKDVEEDVREAIDTLRRWLEMREEDRGKM